MKYARYITLAICMVCMFAQTPIRLRVQRDKYSAYQLGVASQKLQFIEETGPDVSAGERPWSGRTVYDSDWMSCAFSGPSHSRWSGMSADWDAPAGRQTPRWDVHSIGAGTVAMAFAGIWFLLKLASRRARRAQPRGFDVVPVRFAQVKLERP